ncbi:MAG: copper-translocating P-type ATPase [Candidatus Erginobacter occultus]|nr:copper-translocating P-type ATPase [Candidatus Erginobacter occultus]
MKNQHKNHQEPEAHPGHEVHQEHDGHDHSAHHRMMIRDFRQRFFVSLGVTVPILLLSPLIQGFIGLELDFPGEKYLLFALSTFIYFYGGWPFLSGLFSELKKKSPGMMTLIGLAVSVAYFYSSAVVFGLTGKFFFWELATLIDIMLLGHWIEMKSVLSASNALEELARLMPDEAHKIEDGETVEVKLEDVAKGDLLLVKPGEKIPADGVIRKGTSYLNEAMVTGESQPVKKGKDAEVIGGTINGDGSLEIEVKGTGEDSYLSKVINLVKEAQGSKSKSQTLADRAALWLTIIALSAGAITLVVWLISGSVFSFAMERMATVMVITCPHALGLAIPLVVAVSTALAAKNGLLIRDRNAFESSRKISTVLFDKTGTLTEGKFGVSSIRPLAEGWDEKKLIRTAAGLEKNSEHPIGAGITARAKEMEIELPDVSDFRAIKGKGVEGKIDGEEFKIVSPGYLKAERIEIPGASKGEGIATVVYILKGKEPVGSIALSDRIRPQSAEAVARLKEAGIKCWMITGDNEKVARKVSEELDLDGYFAAVLPDQKQEKVKELQQEGEFVAMTGDGVNDAPALAQADVGIAIGSGTDVAAETADIILVNSDPRDVTNLILFGRATYRKMIQNLWWATGYNVVAIPLAAGALYWAGILISPAMGAVLMSLSTVIVAVNAKLLKVENSAS